MFEFTGQYYGHWVVKSYCPWFIEAKYMRLDLVRLKKRFGRERDIYEDSIIIVFIRS